MKNLKLYNVLLTLGLITIERQLKIDDSLSPEKIQRIAQKKYGSIIHMGGNVQVAS